MKGLLCNDFPEMSPFIVGYFNESLNTNIGFVFA